MKYKIFLTICLSLSLLSLIQFTLPNYAQAARYYTDDQSLTIGQNEVIDDDLYLAAGNIEINGTINGDVVAAAGQIIINGKINGDLIIAGGQINLNGSVKDDVRVIGGDVTVKGTIGDDLLAGAGTLTIEKKAIVNGDLTLGAGQAMIGGQVGPVHAGIGQITFESSAKVNGDLIYISDSQAVIRDGATITGKTTYHQPKKNDYNFQNAFTASRLLGVLIFLIMAWLFYLSMPNKTKQLTHNWQDKFGINLLWGILFLIVTPIISLILMVTIIGIPLAIGLTFLYIALLYLGMIVGAIALGDWLLNMGKKDKQLPTNWLTVLVGVIILSLISSIPVIGWIVKLIIFMRLSRLFTKKPLKVNLNLL